MKKTKGLNKWKQLLTLASAGSNTTATRFGSSCLIKSLGVSLNGRRFLSSFGITRGLISLSGLTIGCGITE